MTDACLAADINSREGLKVKLLFCKLFIMWVGFKTADNRNRACLTCEVMNSSLLQTVNKLSFLLDLLKLIFCLGSLHTRKILCPILCLICRLQWSGGRSQDYTRILFLLFCCKTLYLFLFWSHIWCENLVWNRQCIIVVLVWWSQFCTCISVKHARCSVLVKSPTHQARLKWNDGS